MYLKREAAIVDNHSVEWADGDVKVSVVLDFLDEKYMDQNPIGIMLEDEDSGASQVVWLSQIQAEDIRSSLSTAVQSWRDVAVLAERGWLYGHGDPEENDPHLVTNSNSDGPK